MSILTINTKNNCYVIDPDQMNRLQQNVANSFILDQGIFDIKITGGRYRYAKSKTEGEPFVLLWIYGVDGSKFINQNTGFEGGATWITLNGYNETLKLEVKERAVLGALFFDVNNTENSGSITLSISSNKPFLNTLLTVDSKRNCYALDENNLSRLKQAGANYFELNPGRYSIKIRNDSYVSYWSDNNKIEIEPRALIWVKSGKFIAKQTGIEVEETWFSLNGLKDEVILEVKEKTTLTGLFFDTDKDKNEGQIVLTIEQVSVTAWTDYSPSQEYISVTEQKQVQTQTSSVSAGGNFTFFDPAQMEQMWQQMAAKIQNSVTVTEEQDEKKEVYWENLEKSLLKGYQSQAKNLAMQVARVEFMMKALTQQMEVSFNQNFQVWSSHFDKRLNDLINTRITTMVDEQVNIKIANQTQEIKNLVVQQMQREIDQRIDSVVNIKIANQNQEIKNQVIQQMQTEINHRIDSVVNIKSANQAPEIINQVIQQIQADIDQRIDNVVNIKIANQTQEIKNQVVQQIQSDIDQRIDNVVNLRIANQSQNIKNQVIQQIQTDIEQRINSAVNQSTTNNVQVVVNNVINDIDNRINVNLENKILNLRNDVSSIVRNEMTQNFTESIKTTILSDIKKQQFYLDMQSIKSEIENFYVRLGQFETQLYLRINQGDTQLYNWTLEQLIALQNCLTDRQALVEMFESFSARLKTELENAPCVNPSRLTPWSAMGVQPQLSPIQPQQLPGS